MGTDTPIAVLSRAAAAALRLLHPAVRAGHQPAARRDPRGARHLARRLASAPRRNLLDADARRHCRQVVLPFPVIDNDELAKILPHQRRRRPARLRHRTSSAASTTSTAAATALRRAARRDLRRGRRRRSPTAPASSCSPTATPTATCADPVAAAHRAPCTTTWSARRPAPRSACVVEAGDVREVHHVALLIGYGAAAVNPYLAMETVEDLVRARRLVTASSPEKAVANLIKALGKGVLKVMSKMGISTVASYPGAQVFEAVGLSPGRSSTSTSPAPSASSAASASTSSPRRSRPRHARGLPAATASARRTASSRSAASTSGAARASRTCSTPRRSSGCSTPPGRGRYDVFKQYTARVDEQSERLMTLRGLFELGGADARPPVPIDEVEPVAEIVKRFSTGAMSLRLDLPGGARDPRDRDEPARRQVQHRRGRRGRRPAATTPSAARAIKQVASGRFGVTCGVPHQRRRHPDQDGAGRQARRGRPAARPQGLPVGRQDPALHAGRRPDLARRRTTTSTRSRTSRS